MAPQQPKQSRPHSLADAIKALLEVRLHSLRVAGLAEDLEQLVIGQEVEPAWQHKKIHNF